MTNIAITGRMCSGKSTLSDVLVNGYGYERLSFAARLKSLAAEVYNGGEPIQKEGAYLVRDPLLGDRFISGRQVLQRLGEVVKDLDVLFWVRLLAAQAESAAGPFVLDDMRFTFEADYLRENGWAIVRVETPLDVRRERYNDLYGRYPTLVEENHRSETDVDLIIPDLAVSGTGDRYATARNLVSTFKVWSFDFDAARLGA